MFIRWVVRGHKNADAADVTFHDAYLVESYRDDDGNPRQRNLGYLGNIRQLGDQFPGIERELFLLRSEIILESMPEISLAERQQVLGLLHQKVSPLTEDEVLLAFHNNLRWYYRWWQENGGVPSDEEILQILRDARQDPDPSV